MAKPRTEAEERAVQSKLDDALTQAGLPTDSKLRKLLYEESVIVDTGRESTVRILTRDGSDMSHAARLEELKGDFMYSKNFPDAGKKVVPKNDLRSLSENFADIVSGKVRVE